MAVVLLGVGAAWLVHSLSKPPRPKLGAAFAGWTNIQGSPHALVHLPPVSKSKPSRNFFYFEFYRVELDYIYTLADGRCGMGVFEDRGMADANEVTAVAIPVPTNMVGLEFEQVGSWIERRWDNVRGPFRIPSSHFTFEPPLVRFDKDLLDAQR